MVEEPETTTVEVKMDTWAALDRRKERGDSFDDVIRKLIDATPVGMGELEGPMPDVEYGDLQKADDAGPENYCAHCSMITGEQCEQPITHKQKYRMSGDEDWKHFYYCEEHAPE